MSVQNRNFPPKRHPGFGRGRYFSREINSDQNDFDNRQQTRNEEVRESSEVKPKPLKQNYGPKHKEHTAGIKEWRLVVRNLDDYTKREELQTMFSKYGKLKEIVQIPSKIKKDGFAPFAFVQFVSRSDAMKALKELNGSEFKKRKITVALALDKDTYVTKQHEAKEKLKKPKEEMSSDSDEDNIPQSSDEDTEIDFTDSEEDEESESDTKKETKTKSEPTGPLPEFEDLVESDDDTDEDEKPTIKQENESDEEDEESDGEEDADEDGPPNKKQKKNLQTPKERKPDTAVAEGRVVFLKNLPFELDDDELKEEMSKFGEVSLAILCKFKGTEHSTGTGFVHFKEKSVADKVLELIESDGLIIYGSKIRGHRAVPKTDAEKFKKPEKQPSDKRNLYLLRVSLIRPGTPAANNMSPHDEKKRASLLQQVKNKLKLTTMFVSPTRLVIHNIPFSYRDEDLRKVCLESCHNQKARIVESRIMRNKMGVDSKGKPILGKSKGFGFVEFSEHKDALACLKTMNNNPKLFTDEKRPIVEFSIENHVALNIKKKRAEMVKNPKKEMNQDVEATKNEMRKDGAKFLPKKFGAKNRHKTQKNKNSKGRWTQKQKAKRNVGKRKESKPKKGFKSGGAKNKKK